MKLENEINTNMNDIVKLFSYENRLDLEYCDNILRSCVVTNQSPFNRRVIKLHKGVDNLIRFRILNPDRKRVSVDHLSIRARLINSENQERVLERFADITPSIKGDATLTIFEGDLINLAPAFYTLVVTGQETLVPGESTSDNVNTPFFADNTGNIVLTVEVVDGADVTPMESATVLPENWTITNEVGSPTTFTSSAIAGARVQNHLNAVHSFSVATTAFTGTLELRGSLDLQSPSDITNYFPIDITSGTQIIDFDNFTGITAHTFEANFMWIKFIYRPDTSLEDFGTVDKVLLR